MLLTKTAAFRPDTVSPHDADGLAILEEYWDMEVRLPNLIRGAARSRRLADQHKHVAWQSIRAAHSARTLGDRLTARDSLIEAIEARRKARECDAFARRCEREANAIAVASGFLP